MEKVAFLNSVKNKFILTLNEAQISLKQCADNNLKQRKSDPVQTFVFGWGSGKKLKPTSHSPSSLKEDAYWISHFYSIFDLSMQNFKQAKGRQKFI